MKIFDWQRCFFCSDEPNDELRLHISPVLFMETMFDVAIAVGKKSQKSWDALFK